MKSLGAKTIAFPLPAWVIAAYDATGRPNAMTASWTGICCSQPPCVYFSARESRYTHECVTARRAFTVNIPGRDLLEEIDYLGTASGRQEDKLTVAGLSAAPAEHVDAPYIEGFPLVMECRLIQDLTLGTHTMFIGEIVDAKCGEELLDASGKPDTARIRPFVYSPPDGSYFAVSDVLGRGYKVGKRLTED